MRRLSIAITCICLSACMIKPKRLKLKSPNLAQKQSITIHQPPINIRSKGQGHRVQLQKGARVACIS